MIYVVVWLALCLVVAYAGSQRGRSGVGLFFLSLLLSPLVGLLVTIALPARKMKSDTGYILCQCGKPYSEKHKRCPSCGAEAPSP